MKKPYILIISYITISYFKIKSNLKFYFIPIDNKSLESLDVHLLRAHYLNYRYE